MVDRKFKTLLITGGAGFIGSNFIHYIARKYPEYRIINLDKLTYAGNLENLRDIEDNPNYKFIKGDIADRKIIDEIFKSRNIDAIINFAAESHVDRSIEDPGVFIRTDIYGTYVLLEAARKYNSKIFLQISTDEVYGSIEDGSFAEDDPLKPSSPYSASKAGAEMIVRSFFKTFGTPIIITRTTNNFGPYQYPEKIIPLFVTNLIDNIKVPLYGDGMNEKPNIWITKEILKLLDKPESMIEPVEDRLGHDRRYSVDCTKLKKDLGWETQYDFEEALKKTVNWYAANEKWWRPLKGRSI